MSSTDCLAFCFNSNSFSNENKCEFQRKCFYFPSIHISQNKLMRNEISDFEETYIQYYDVSPSASRFCIITEHFKIIMKSSTLTAAASNLFPKTFCWKTQYMEYEYEYVWTWMFIKAHCYQFYSPAIVSRTNVWLWENEWIHCAEVMLGIRYESTFQFFAGRSQFSA